MYNPLIRTTSPPVFPNLPRTLLAAVQKLAGVHALNRNEELRVLLVVVRVLELDLGQRGPTPGLAAGGNGKKSKDQGRRQMKTKKAGSIGYFSYETTDRCMAPGFSVVGVGAPEVTGILPGEVRHAS